MFQKIAKIIFILLSVLLSASADPSPTALYAVACKIDTSECVLASGTPWVDLDDHYEGGTINYVNGFDSNGWDELTVELNRTAKGLSLRQKYYALGYAEAFLTYDRIWSNYRNTYDEAFKNRMTPEVVHWITENIAWILRLGDEQTSNVYIQKFVNLIHYIKGMSAGYREGCLAAICPDEKQATFSNETMMFILNMQGELEDLMAAYKNTNHYKHPINVVPGECSAFLRTTDDDVLFGHSTFQIYSSMTRQFKTYRFEDNNFVSFSARPGFIHSKDDFMITGNGLAIMETSIACPNTELHKKFIRDRFTGLIPSYLRSMSASLLAHSSQDWTYLFAQNNSGTHNCQWLVLDLKTFKPGEALPKNFFRVLETLPGTVVSSDETPLLQRQKYFGSVNMPFYRLIDNISGGIELYQKYGDYYSFTKTPRSKIFARDFSKVNGIESLKQLMRYNDFQNDPLSVIPNCSQCNPVYSGLLSISARSDLNLANGNYGPIDEMAQMCFGGVDSKVSSYKLMFNADNDHKIHIINGPTDQGQPPFTFKNSACHDKLHNGMPEEWKFNWQLIKIKPKDKNEYF